MKFQKATTRLSCFCKVPKFSSVGCTNCERCGRVVREQDYLGVVE